MDILSAIYYVESRSIGNIWEPISSNFSINLETSHISKAKNDKLVAVKLDGATINIYFSESFQIFYNNRTFGSGKPILTLPSAAMEPSCSITFIDNKLYLIVSYFSPEHNNVITSCWVDSTGTGSGDFVFFSHVDLLTTESNTGIKNITRGFRPSGILVMGNGDLVIKTATITGTTDLNFIMGTSYRFLVSKDKGLTWTGSNKFTNSYTYGYWCSKQIVELSNGNVISHNNTGSGGTNGWFYQWNYNTNVIDTQALTNWPRGNAPVCVNLFKVDGNFYVFGYGIGVRKYIGPTSYSLINFADYTNWELVAHGGAGAAMYSYVIYFEEFICVLFGISRTASRMFFSHKSNTFKRVRNMIRIK